MRSTGATAGGELSRSDDIVLVCHRNNHASSFTAEGQHAGTACMSIARQEASNLLLQFIEEGRLAHVSLGFLIHDTLDGAAHQTSRFFTAAVTFLTFVVCDGKKGR